MNAVFVLPEHERGQETVFTSQNLHHMFSAIYVAQEMGEKLGRS